MGAYNEHMKNKKDIMIKIISDPKYKGKHIVYIANQVFTAKTGTQANKLLDRLKKNIPQRLRQSPTFLRLTI